MSSRTRRAPKQMRARATVDRIIESTEQLLEQDRPSTTNHIARRAGVNVATIYQYFSDRDDIVDRVLLRYALGVADVLRGAIDRDEDDDVGGALARLVAALFAEYQRRPRLHAALRRHALRRPTPALGHIDEQIEALLMRRIAKKVPQQDGVNVEAAGRLLIQFVEYAATRTATSAASAASQAEIERLVRVWFEPSPSVRQR